MLLYGNLAVVDSHEEKTNTPFGQQFTGRGGVEEQSPRWETDPPRGDKAIPGHRVKTIEIRISGKVQRVGMRNCIRTLAGRLNIMGEVMNLPDGTVLALATGDPILLEKFVSMIYSCPRAVIRELEIHDHTLVPFQNFLVKRIE
jgi:acylphosphatase